MIRRQFLRLAALAGASGLPSLTLAASRDRETITYQIKGFSCATCAVGLDATLEKKDGVVSSKSSYREAETTISFEPAVISQRSLKDAIEEMGFTAVPVGSSVNK
jgi:Cu+-exporting ATPase